MKIYFKQTMAKLLFSGKAFLVFFAGVLFIFLSSSISYAPTKIGHVPSKMSDSDLSEIDAQAFFKIEEFSSGNNFWTTPTYEGTHSTYNTGSQNAIRISLDIDVEASAFIQSQKLGYRNGAQGGITTTTEVGWDLDFTNFWVGDRSSTGDGAPLKLHGLYLDVGFDNIGNNATRTLNYLEIGSQHVTGNVTQSLNQVNGLVLAGTGQNNGVMLRQTASGTRTVNFNNQVMAFVFASRYHYSDYSGTGTNVQGVFIKLPSYHTDNDLHRPGDAGGW